MLGWLRFGSEQNLILHIIVIYLVFLNFELIYKTAVQVSLTPNVRQKAQKNSIVAFEIVSYET